MNRLALVLSLTVSSLALANAHHHHFSGGSGSSSLDFEREGACLAWAPADGGVDGGVDAVELAEAADAGHPDEVCVEHARTFGCSAAPAAPLLMLAVLALKRKRV